MVHKPAGPGMSSDLEPSYVVLAEGCLSEQGCNREMELSMGQGCDREMELPMGSCEFCTQASLLTTVFPCFIIQKMEVRGWLDG